MRGTASDLRALPPAGGRLLVCPRRAPRDAAAEELGAPPAPFLGHGRGGCRLAALAASIGALTTRAPHVG
jgi:hypothetical protein